MKKHKRYFGQVKGKEGKMMQIANSPYGKAVSISLLVHIALIGLLLWLVQETSLATPFPETVEIVPAQLLNMDDINADQDFHPDVKRTVLDRSISKENSSETSATQLLKPMKSRQNTRGNVDEQSESLPPILGGNSVGVAATSQMSSGMTGVRGRYEGEKSVKSSPQKSTSVNVLSGASPPYPRSARQAGWEGIVVVRILVDTDGSPASVSIRSSSGYAIFDETAVNAVMKWKFSPATKEGQPIAAYHDVKISFRLDDSE